MEETIDRIKRLENAIDDVMACAAGIGKLAELIEPNHETGGIAALLGAQVVILRQAGDALDGMEGIIQAALIETTKKAR